MIAVFFLLINIYFVSSVMNSQQNKMILDQQKKNPMTIKEYGV
jgi:hypothetical protein